MAKMTRRGLFSAIAAIVVAGKLPPLPKPRGETLFWLNVNKDEHYKFGFTGFTAEGKDGVRRRVVSSIYAPGKPPKGE